MNHHGLSNKKLWAIYESLEPTARQIVEILSVCVQLERHNLREVLTQQGVTAQNKRRLSEDQCNRIIHQLSGKGILGFEEYLPPNELCVFRIGPMIVTHVWREGRLEALAGCLDLADHFDRNRRVHRIYFNSNMLPIQLYRAFYRNDFERMRKVFSSAGHQDMSAVSERLYKLDADFFASRRPQIRIGLLDQIQRNVLELSPVGPEIMRDLESAALALRLGEWDNGRAILGFALLIRGRIKRAASVIEGAGGWLSDSLQGAVALLRGDAKAACACFDDACHALKKERDDHSGLLPEPLEHFHVIALLAEGSPERLDQAKTLLGLFHDEENGDCYETLIHAIENPAYLSKRNYLFSQYYQGIFPEFFKIIATYWFNPQLIHVSSDHLAQLIEPATSASLDFPAAEMAWMLHRLGINSKKNKALADAYFTREGCRPLAELIQLDPPWKRALLALETVNEQLASKVSTSKQGAVHRMAWRLDFMGWDYSIKPVVQKANKRGGWSKGKVLSLPKLYEDIDELDYLDAQDQKICAALMSRDLLIGSKREVCFDMRKALRALVDHPRLFAHREPEARVLLEKGDPEIRVEQKGKAVEVCLYPPQHSYRRNTFTVIENEPHRFSYYEFTSHHERVGEILSGGLVVPAEGRDEIAATVANLAGPVVVNADLPGLAQSEGDPRIHLQLYRLGESLRLRFAVRPFGAAGPYCTPAEGGQVIYARIAGERRVAKRDFAEENRRREALFQTCPTLAEGEEQGNELLFEAAETCLSLLMELAQQGEEVVLTWVQGEAMRVQEVSGNMKIRIRSAEEWFELSGTLKIDESEVLDMAELLALLNTHPGRFIPLGKGRFLALTRRFRQRMAELNTLTDQGRTNKIHPLAAPLFEELADELGTVDSDGKWRETLERMNKAQAMEPVVPAAFKAQLRPYQEQGFSWLRRLSHWGVGACLADDMGLGKTIQTLALLTDLGSEGPALVVAPTSVCPNWISECLRFAPTLNPIRFGGGYRRTELKGVGPFDLVVCSYGMLQSATSSLTHITWRTVVLDEAQAIKNPGTKRARAAFKLKSSFRMMTTGTPVENHLSELWSLFRFLNPGLLGGRTSFNRTYAGPIQRDQDPSRMEALHNLVRPFILRRLKSQVLKELPPRTEVTLQVELDEEEQAFYEALRRKALATLSGKDEAESEHFRILAEIMRLRRACCNPQLVDPEWRAEASKMKVFAEILDELLAGGHKALVFSQFVDHLAILRNFLDTQGISYQYLDGTTPARARSERVAAFQRGAGDVFLISLRAGGVGLNLTAADYVIHMDPWWNPAVEDQASDRAHRIGQKRPVTVYRLVGKDTIEEKIVALHAQKREMADTLLDGTDIAGKISADMLYTLIQEG